MASHPISQVIVDNVRVDKDAFRLYTEVRQVLVLANGNEIQGFELPNTTVVIVGAAAYGYDPLDTTSVHNGTSVLVDGTLPTGRRYIPGGIAADAVTNAMLSEMPLYSIKANATAGTANPTDVVRAGLTNVAAATTHRAIGWLSTGELRSFDLGNLAGLNTVGTTQIDDDAVTYAKIQNINTARILGRNTAAAGDVEELTLAPDHEFNVLAIRLAAWSGGDITKAAGATSGTIINDSVTYAKIQNISVTQRVLGRNTAAAGDTEEVTATQVLDWIGATQGQVLFRGAGAWTALAAGTAAFYLRAAGAAANPTWQAITAAEVVNTAAGNIAATTVQTAINELDTEKAGLALANIFSTTQTIQSISGTSGEGPLLILDRFSGSPAAADFLGSIEWHGRSSTAVERTYADIRGFITSPTNLAEAGGIEFNTMQSGTAAARFRVGLGLYYSSGSDMGANTINAIDFFDSGVNINTIYQGLDATLTALAAYSTVGIVTMTAADTFAGRTLTAPAAGLTISNPAGTAGNPTFALANDLGALEGLGSTGIAVRSAADTWVQRSVVGTASQITVTNGDGVAGNPTISLPADVLIPTILTVPNSGLHLLDTNASHDLIITPGSDLTLDRILTLVTGDAARTLDISAGSVTISAFGASLIDDAAAVNARTTLGLVIGTDVQAQDAELAAIAGLTSAANKGITFTGVGTAATYDLSAFALTFLDDVAAVNVRSTLGLIIGTDVQAQNARLADVAAISWVQGDVMYFNGTNLVRLPPGTSGQFLKTFGAAANPAWATLAGGGDMLASNNLSDLGSIVTARTNLDVDQLGTISGVNNQTGTTYTTVAGDRGKAVTMNNAAANTLTFPSNASVAYPINTQIHIVQLGAGQTTIALTTDTLRSAGGKTKLVGQYSAATMLKIAATEWVLIGDITA